MYVFANLGNGIAPPRGREPVQVRVFWMLPPDGGCCVPWRQPATAGVVPGAGKLAALPAEGRRELMEANQQLSELTFGCEPPRVESPRV